jgi:CheY-like chemotaxis protein
VSRSYLLIDDNAEFRENLAEILVDHGAQVTLASGGEQALELVRTTRFDAIVTDMRMPKMSGAEFVHALRAIDNDVPVVLLTAYSNELQLRAARGDGLLAVLSKPQPMPRLLAVLDGARRGTVAVVEDDSALCENLTEVLNGRGLTVVSARALNDVALFGVTPFAALVDLHVPGGEPGAALERFVARYPQTPTIVITAFAGEAPAAAECFRKPFDTARLIERLEDLGRAR